MPTVTWTVAGRRGRGERHMAKVIADISVSLDGYRHRARSPSLEHGLGRGGEGLHRWAFDGGAGRQGGAGAMVDATGAVVMGRRTFDVVDGPHGWGGEVGYGAGLASRPPPVLVVTRRPPESGAAGRPVQFRGRRCAQRRGQGPLDRRGPRRRGDGRRRGDPGRLGRRPGRRVAPASVAGAARRRHAAVRTGRAASSRCSSSTTCGCRRWPPTCRTASGGEPVLTSAAGRAGRAGQ